MRFFSAEPARSGQMQYQVVPSGITLLIGEVDLFVHHGKDPTINCDAIYVITNWALRVTLAHHRPHYTNCTIPLSTIVEIKKTGGKKRGGWYGITLHLSTCTAFRIGFSRQTKARPPFFQAIQKAVGAPFSFPRAIWCPPPTWVDRLAAESHWDIYVNDVCPSYPPRLLVPPGLPDDVIRQCAAYRTRQRLPFLSYVLPSNGAPLLRSSQPKTGFTGSVSSFEARFMTAARSDRRLAILDCRPRLNAVVNQFTGGGYESVGHNANSSFEFLGIPNIHRVRKCYVTMIDSFQKRKALVWREWATLTLQLITAARIGVEKLHANAAVLVHCTDGWDRTTQVTGLVQLIVDPRTRTFDGFRELIQKEWCDAGHMFTLRCAHKPHRHLDQSAPIFGQFIDAVWQLIAVQPAAFEYNERLLAFVLFHSYAQLYGDFLGGCYKDRTQSERPPSIWSLFDDGAFKAHFSNPDFAPLDGDLVSEVAAYQVSEAICSCPLFGCDPEIPMRADPPPIDSSWLAADNLIPENDDEGLPTDEARELESEVNESLGHSSGSASGPTDWSAPSSLEDPTLLDAE
jgi:hypothetical protein